MNAQSIGYVSHHLVNFKVDLDVAGAANRVEYVKMKNEGAKHPDLADPAETVYVWRLIRQQIERESDTTYKHSLSEPMYMLVTSPNDTNRYGYPRSYRILPLTLTRLMLPGTHAIANAISWAKHTVITATRLDT